MKCLAYHVIGACTFIQWLVTDHSKQCLERNQSTYNLDCGMCMVNVYPSTYLLYPVITPILCRLLWFYPTSLSLLFYWDATSFQSNVHSSSTQHMKSSFCFYISLSAMTIIHLEFWFIFDAYMIAFAQQWVSNPLEWHFLCWFAKT
jgi:hypothetical protein